MRRGHVDRAINTLWLVLILGCVLAVGYGIWPKHHPSKVGLIPPVTVTDTIPNYHGVYPKAPHDVGVCKVVGVPYRDILKPAHGTFTEVVTKPLDRGALFSTAAGVTFLFGHYNGDPGRYGPAIAYTMARYVGPTDHLKVGPTTDPKVLASAHALDALLAGGGCP